MASESEMTEASIVESRSTSRNRDSSILIPFMLSIANTDDPNETRAIRHRIFFFNPFTQGMTVIEGTGSLDSLFHESPSKEGQPPASKASIEAMPKVQVTENDAGGECAICLEEWEVGGEAREMPCKHKFHGSCIEKWLNLHGSCPVCRFNMPLDEQESNKKRENDDEEEGSGERRRVERETWFRFWFSRRSRSDGDSNQTPSADSSPSQRPDSEMEE